MSVARYEFNHPNVNSFFFFVRMVFFYSNWLFLFFQFNIHCEDSYKLALIGSINNVGRFIFLPLTGMLADR